MLLASCYFSFHAFNCFSFHHSFVIHITFRVCFHSFYCMFFHFMHFAFSFFSFSRFSFCSIYDVFHLHLFHIFFFFSLHDDVIWCDVRFALALQMVSHVILCNYFVLWSFPCFGLAWWHMVSEYYDMLSALPLHFLSRTAYVVSHLISSHMVLFCSALVFILRWLKALAFSFLFFAFISFIHSSSFMLSFISFRALFVHFVFCATLSYCACAMHSAFLMRSWLFCMLSLLHLFMLNSVFACFMLHVCLLHRLGRWAYYAGTVMRLASFVCYFAYFLFVRCPMNESRHFHDTLTSLVRHRSQLLLLLFILFILCIVSLSLSQYIYFICAGRWCSVW
jgi:hypothetical protein